ncbi:MAG TPA: DUF885 family protein, partial [Verrucomicrobiae bacterium]|nr:DUF885 family protein [Verrucomicrobiae bacterium]
MNRFFWSAAFGVAVFLTMATLPAFSESSEDAKLNAFFQSYLDEHFRQQPLDATELGDHRFDGLLDDISPQARRGWLDLTRKTLKELPHQVNYTHLSRDGQIDFEIFQHELETDIWLTENTHPFEEDPRIYGDYINDGVYSLLSHSTLPLEVNISNCLSRMAQIPRIIEAAKATLTHPPKPILETAIRQNRGAISFYQKDIFEYAGDTRQLDKLKEASSGVAAQLEDYQKFLEGDLMSRANGEWRLGASKFKKKLELVLDSGMTADQVFADAEAEFAQVRADMFVVARQLWATYFSKTPMPPDDPEGRRETITKVINAVNQEHG